MRRIVAACLHACMVALTACTSTAPRPATQFSPQGDSQAWFDPAYAQGISGEWQVGDGNESICGIGEGIVAVNRWQPESRTSQVYAVDLASADGSASDVGAGLRTEPLWELDDASCSKNSVDETSVLVTSPGALRNTNGETRIMNVEMRSGETQDLYTQGGIRRFEGAYPLGSAEGIIYVAAEFLGEGTYVLALQDGEVLSEQSVGTGVHCVWLESHVGCAGSTELSVLDTATGLAAIDSQKFSGNHMLVWATDGYALVPTETTDDDGELTRARAFNFEGVEIDSEMPRFEPEAPGYMAGVFYPLADFSEFQNVAVDASGAFVSYWNTSGDRENWATLWGKDLEPREALRWPVAVAADGTAAVFTHDDGGVHLVDAGGETIETLTGSASGIRVYDGLIVEKFPASEDADAPTDRVLLPAN